MKKLLTLAGVTVATTGLLVGGVATTAGAETIHRNGAKKVTITADTTKKVPAGAKVTKKRITVKKGKKTVAKNKKQYRAKKGKYKVTSTVTYRPVVTKTVAAADLMLGTCTVTSRNIVQDNSSYKYDDWLSGDVWVDYTANCPAQFYDSNFDLRPTNVDVKWRESDYVFVDDITGDKATDLAANDDFYYVGQFTDSAYNYTLLSGGTYSEYGAKAKVKTKRTVRVR